MLLIFHKPFGVLSQFTPDGSPNRPLSEFSLPAGVYPIGRLDADSEGLLLFTDEKAIIDRLLNPRHAHRRTYHVQVERELSQESLTQLAKGVPVQGRPTLPCKVLAVETPKWPERSVPIRFRKNVPTAWLELTLTEGRNRQVRRMTAAVGHPTLRLIRVGIGAYRMEHFEPGSSQEASRTDRERIFT